jgi:hypothetical protein
MASLKKSLVLDGFLEDFALSRRSPGRPAIRGALRLPELLRGVRSP